MWSSTVLAELSGSITASRHASRLLRIFHVNTSCWRSCASPIRVRHCSICCAFFPKSPACCRMECLHTSSSQSQHLHMLGNLYLTHVLQDFYSVCAPMASLEGLFLGLPLLDLRATFSQTTCLFQRLEKLGCSHYQVSAHLAHQPLPRALQCGNFAAARVLLF